MVDDIKTCQQLNIVKPGDAALQALAILSTVHGFVTMVNDKRVNALLGQNPDINAVRDMIMASIFEGLGA